jgi:hypothetical protein
MTDTYVVSARKAKRIELASQIENYRRRCGKGQRRGKTNFSHMGRRQSF